MKNQLTKILFIAQILIATSLVPLSSLAQGTNPGGSGGTNPAPIQYNIKIDNPLAGGVDNLPALLNLIIKNIINPIGGIVAVLMIMYAGFLYVTARGNQTQITKAHQAILYAAIGAAILLGSNLVATAIQGTIEQIGK